MTRARFLAADRIAAVGEDMGALAEAPPGEELWREGSDRVVLTADGWLVWLNAGKAALYGRRVRATEQWIREVRR